MALLEVDGLSVGFGPVRVLEGVGFRIERGETLALVGESGSGKSMTALAVLGLLAEPGRIRAGRIRFDGVDLAADGGAALRSLRGDRIAMVFQEPMAAMNPLISIGEHVGEPLRLHRGLTRKQAREAAIGLLDDVGIAQAARRVDDYPHQLSGGMRQRVMIAAALACEPDLLIADEPTTALDVTIQAQIMALLGELRVRRSMAMLFITHDLGLVADQADRVAVMYAGRIVEAAPKSSLFRLPRHPYTRALIQCIPAGEGADRLVAIDGTVPPMDDLPAGCRFSPRCPQVQPDCRTRDPQSVELSPQAADGGHRVACLHPPSAPMTGVVEFVA